MNLCIAIPQPNHYDSLAFKKLPYSEIALKTMQIIVDSKKMQKKNEVKTAEKTLKR